MRWWVFFLIAGMFLALMFSPSISSSDKIEDEVLQVMQEQGEARVIVQLKDEVKTGYGIFSVQQDVEVAEVVDDFNAENVNVSRVYDAVEGFAGIVNAEGLEQLRQDSRVERVYYDAIVQIQLQSSRGVVNATRVYNRYINGLNITGANQTICVIDTGINVSLNEFAGKVVGQYCFCSLNEGATANCCSGNSAQNASAGDNNGHGSHVAGIAAANGTNGSIQGVAPDALLVVIKTMNSSGSGSSSDIISGLNYCINNRTLFNISVISLSFGSGSYTNEDTCQSDDAIAPTASSAVANGIFVVASSGNDASTTVITGPACAKNVTSVGAITKAFAIPGYSNRNSLLDLLAPGGANDGSQNNDINSSSYNGAGGQRYKSGTSMAAPHVAGAAALLLQYKKEENGTVLNPRMLENVLKITGVNISDSGSGLNISAVDVLAALIHLDAKSPNVTLNITPRTANFSVSNVTLNFTVLDTNLGNFSVNISYPNGTHLANSSRNITLTTSNLTVVGNYTVMVFANDSRGNVNITILNLTVTGVDVALISPIAFFNTTNRSLSVNCSVSSYNVLSNISLYTNVSGSFLLNQTASVSGTRNSSNFSLSGISDGNYLWNCLAYDNSSNSAWAASNRTFRVDNVLPAVQLLTPLNNTNQSTSGGITFTFNATDTYLRNCSLVIDDVADQSNNSILPFINQSFTKTFSTSNYYNWAVNCSDYSNNRNGSVTFRVNVSVTTTTTTTTLGGSGTGGGSGNPGGVGSAGAPTTAPTTTLKPASQPAETITKERVYQQAESITDITALEKDNPELKLALTLTNKEVEDLAVAGSTEASVSRNLESGDGVSTVETTFTFQDVHAEILMYDEVPKIFAADASRIQVAVEEGEYQVVKADPVFVFTFKNVTAGRNYHVSYSVVELMPASILDVFDKPILMYDKSEQPELEQPAQISGAGVAGGAKQLIQRYQRFWWAGAAGLLLVIVGMMLWGGRKGKKVEKPAEDNARTKLP